MFYNVKSPKVPYESDDEPGTFRSDSIWTAHVDAENAYLNASLNEFVVAHFPPGFEKAVHLLQILRAIYESEDEPDDNQRGIRYEEPSL